MLLNFEYLREKRKIKLLETKIIGLRIPLKETGTPIFFQMRNKGDMKTWPSDM